MEERTPNDDDIEEVDDCQGLGEECKGHTLVQFVAIAIQAGNMKLIQHNRKYTKDWDDDG